jgi:hypothetical protein
MNTRAIIVLTVLLVFGWRERRWPAKSAISCPQRPERGSL